MLYLLQRSGGYYYNRRVPEAYRKFDSRDVIRFSLKTADRKAALRLAIAHNEKLEAYWQTLEHSGQQQTEGQFKALIDRSRLLNFAYMPAPLLAQMPLPEIIQRLLHIEKENYNELHVEAVLGKMQPPDVFLDQVIHRYFALTKDKLLNKSAHQIRKWENPRKKAMANLILCIGNKAIHQLSREDMLKFRDWWIERIKAEGLIAASANKDIIHVKTMICSIADNLKIKIDAAHIFKKLILDDDDGKRRLPFESSYIINTLLNAKNLQGLNEQARWALHAFSETGAGLNELTGLLPEDIVLDHDIPHIIIRPRKGRVLKTRFRERKIPLVGYALDAFKACPNGFTHYRDRPDSLSSILGKYLSERDLLPTSQHSVYSLRHSFQDRLLAVDAPDRVQADLMGHKFHRPMYGDGASLAHKLEWLKKIELKTKGTVVKL